MKREIFCINAFIVDANGTFNQLSGYPKAFDSKHYANDIEKTCQRAYSDYYDTLSAMYKIDTRQTQMVTLTRMSDGVMIAMNKLGTLADLPEPETESEQTT